MVSKERAKRRAAKEWQYVRDNYQWPGACMEHDFTNYVCTMKPGHVGDHVATYTLVAPRGKMTEEEFVNSRIAARWPRRGV